MTTELTQSYLDAVATADSLESKMCVLGAYQYNLMSDAHEDIFGRPLFKYRHTLQVQVDPDTGNIEMYTQDEFKDVVLSFALAVTSVAGENGVIYNSFVESYKVKKDAEDLFNQQQRQARKLKLQTDLAAIEALEQVNLDKVL